MTVHLGLLASPCKVTLHTDFFISKLLCFSLNQTDHYSMAAILGVCLYVCVCTRTG